ncbi:MAG: hypothetical protein ACT4QD_24560 [Acidobacteriota bacterium]
MYLRSCAWSADGRKVLGAGGYIHVWDAVTGAELERLDIAGLTAALSPDGVTVAIGLDAIRDRRDSGLSVWSLDTSEVKWLPDAPASVTCCAFSGDGRWLATGGADGSVILWNVARIAHECSLGSHQGSVTACAFASDDCEVISVGDDNTVRNWTGDEVRSVALDDRCSGCAVSPDGRLVAVGSGGKVHVLDRATFEPVAQTECLRITSLAWSPNGGSLAAGTGDKLVHLWRAPEMRPLAIFAGHGDFVNACAFSPDSTLLASASEDGTLKLWDLSAPETLTAETIETSWVTACAVSPDLRHVASESLSRSFRIRESTSGHDVAVLPPQHTDSLAFTPDGRMLICASSNGLNSIDSAEGWVVKRHCAIDGATACAVSPDGIAVAVGDENGTLRLLQWEDRWDDPSPVLLREPRGPLPIRQVSFAPDAFRIAVVDTDGLAIWDRFRHRLVGRTANASWTVAYSPDGRSLATNGADANIDVLDARSLQPIRTLKSPVEPMAVSFSRDGRWLIAATGNLVRKGADLGFSDDQTRLHFSG